MDNHQSNQEHKQLQDLPLPDMEQSWEKMKQLLDQDDNNRRPVVPVFLKSCAGWGFLLLLAGAVTWLILNAEISSKDTTAKQTEKKVPQTNPSSRIPSSSNSLPASTSASPVTKTNTTVSSPSSASTDQVNVSTDPSTENSHVIIKQVKGHSKPLTSSTTTPQSPQKQPPGKALQQIKPGTIQTNSETQIKSAPPEMTIEKAETQEVTEKSSTPALRVSKTGSRLLADSIQGKPVLVNADANPEDSLAAKDSAARVAPDSVNKKEVRQQVQRKRAFIFSGGVGMQQQVPLGNQKAVPYDYYGRSNSVYDYIPSIYLRLEKSRKWFIQGEFRYGAPQSLKEFSYSRQTRLDSSLSLVTTTYRLKKTYYHQLPLSFNYYVRPNWSVGIGGIYSRFSGAVTEKEVKSKNIQTQVETVSRQIVNIRHFTDSFLYKTQVHLLVQTEYHWKRFTFGVRYTRDIQPFIKYTQPDGRINVEKNHTLQLLARFRLWQTRQEKNRKQER